ncbi:MAG: hypothetical protein AAFN00_05170 [Cyanobacteria bacterium J06558_2]
MPELTSKKIFGDLVELLPPSNPQNPNGTPILAINLQSLANLSQGGQIQDGLGFTNPSSINPDNIDDYAVPILIGLLMLVSQNQATGIYDDPEQSIFISDGGKRFGQSTRTNQIWQVLSVNVFSDTNIQAFPDLQSLVGSSDDDGAPPNSNQL